MQASVRELETISPTQPEKVGNLPPRWKRTTIGLEIPRDITIQAWLRGVKTLEKTGKGYQWEHGDALVQGEQLFGEEWSQAIDPVEELRQQEEGSDDTYRKYMQVASRIPAGNRFPQLTWTHHLKVAFLDTEQEQLFWLRIAIRDRLSVRALERAIKKAHEPEKEETPSDLLLLQDENVRAWLTAYIELINAHLVLLDALPPPGAAYLRDMLYKHREHAIWQLDRTKAKDCEAILKAIDETNGLSEDDLWNWLQERGYFTSGSEFEATIDYMEESQQILSDSAGKEGKLKEARGKPPTFYVRWYKKREKVPLCKRCHEYHKDEADCMELPVSA